MADLDQKLCNHCGQNVSVNNWLLHESRCARINTVCPKCKEPVLKANLEEHEEEYHAIEICDLCRKRVEKWLMDKHKEEECVRKPMRCPYCKLDVALQDFPEHEQVCGSRTEKCHLCGRYVMLMDLDDHMVRCGQSDVTIIKPPHSSSPLLPHNRRDAVVDRHGGDHQGRSSPALQPSRVPVVPLQKTYLPSDMPGSIDLTGDDTPPFVDESEMPYDGNRDKSSDNQTDTIPCESCGKDIPWTDFEDHMRNCDIFDCSEEDDPLSYPNRTPVVNEPIRYINANIGPGPSQNTYPQEVGNIGHRSGIHEYPQHATHGSTNPNTRNEPPPREQPFSGHDNVMDDDNDTYIPCEVCGQSFSLLALGEHQDTCMRENKYNDTPSYERHIPVLQDEAVTIPCEYCEEAIEFTELVEHQASCDRNPMVVEQRRMHGQHGNRGKKQAEGLEIDVECSYCLEKFSELAIKNHQEICLQRKSLERRLPKKHTASESSRSNRSCVRCGLSFPSSAIRRHETDCMRNPSNTVDLCNSPPLYDPGPPTNFGQRDFEEHNYGGNTQTQYTYDDDNVIEVGESPLSVINRHPSSKGNEPLSKTYSADVQLPCEFCNQQFKLSLLYSHQASCPHNPASSCISPPFGGDKDFTEEESDKTTVPCEKCLMPFPLQRIHSHEIQCRGST